MNEVTERLIEMRKAQVYKGSANELLDILRGCGSDGLEADGWIDEDGEFHYGEEPDEGDLIDEAYDAWRDEQMD
jgi:hypothetical protein